MMNHKGRIILSCLMVLVFALSCFTIPMVSAATTYQANWGSVDTHNPAPEWLQDAKFGIFFHWGLYSVPAYDSEWYGNHLYETGGNVYNYHVSHYGDPFSNWPYHYFLTGANDKSGHFTQFAPKLTSQGGAFDPNAWAQLFVDAGAKFAGPCAEHHDGVALWNSTVNPWNTVNYGPKMDLVAQFANAIRAKNLKFMLSNHFAFNYNGFYAKAPAQSDPNLQKLYGQMSKTAEDQYWYDQLKEVIDNYQPDYIWHDFMLGNVAEQQRLNFLAYYYNKGIDWGKEVAVSYADGFDTKGECIQFERGSGPANVNTNVFVDETSVSGGTWGYVQGISYCSPKAMLNELIDSVSKNAIYVLSLAPMADGTIPQGQQDICTGIGNWLKTYGEAIYSTRAYTVYGEGPTTGGPKEGTAADIRFTRNKANNTLYAIGLGWPSNNQMVITSMKSGVFNTSTITGVSMVGGSACSWSQDGTGLKINLPSSSQNNMGYAVKITFSGTVPNISGTVNLALNKPVTVSSTADSTVGSNAVDGDLTTRWSSAYSDPQWIYVDLGSSQSISSVKLYWENAYGKAFTIQVSNDASNWSNVYSTTTGTGGVQNISFGATNARYVRMYGTQRGTTYGYSLWEFQVFGSGNNQTPTPTPTPSPTPAPSGTKYEAESGTLANGATVASDSAASNGQCVQNMHLTNASCQINNVDGGSGGSRTLNIIYAANGTGTLSIYVNSTLVASPIFPTTGGWSTYTGNLQQTITLNSGTGNTVKLVGGNGGINLDYIQVSGGPQNNSVYHLICQASGKALDNAGSTTDGTAVTQWTDNSGNSNQEWKVVDVGGGYYHLICQKSGKALDNAGSTTEGTTVTQWADGGSGNTNQNWNFVDVGGGYYHLICQKSGKALDNGGSTTDGTIVKQWTEQSGNSNQNWKLEFIR